MKASTYVRKVRKILPACPEFFFGVLAGSMLFIMNRVVNIRASITVTQEALTVILDHTNILHRHKEITIPYDSIKHFAEDINTQNDNKKYFTISRRNAASVLLMQPRAMDDTTVEEFSILLHTNIQLYNSNAQTPAVMKIKEGSFYDAPWAKAITWITYIAFASLPVAALAGIQIPWVKIIQVYVVGSAWLIAYHANRKKKDQKGILP